MLVDWDTVDTVRLFRKVSKRMKALRPAVDRANSDSSNLSSARTMVASNSPATHESRQGGEPNIARIEPSTIASENGIPATGFEGLTVLPSVEEISWGSGKKRGGAAGTGTARTALSANSARQSTNEELPTATPSVKATGTDHSAPHDDGVRKEDEEEEGGEEWRCSICLGSPIAPRVTKCGHGPFCLVCILRHLKSEESARCPLCFDKMHR